MTMQLIHKVQEKFTKKNLPNLKAGQTVRIHQKIKEGDKYRIQVLQGLIIKINAGHGTDKTFTVRKVVSGVGVERILPLHSTMIDRIEIIKQAKVRRAKLYYTRKLFGKKARMKEEYLKETLGIIDEKEVTKEEKGETQVQEEVLEEKAEEVAKA